MASVLLFPLLGLIALALWTLLQQRRRLRLARERGACQLCGAAFRDAQIEYAGGVTRAQRARLDRFQARFAAWNIRCLECGALNLCTRDGIAFRAEIERGD